MKFFSVLFAALFFSGSLFFGQAHAATFTAVSRSGDNLSLEFNEDVITRNSSEAIFCNGRRAMVVNAELWMPSMGHGSSPIAVYPQNNSCTALRNLNFMMSGDWELRLNLNNMDSGVFAFEVR